MNFKTEVWPIGRFIHYARNPRKNDAQVDRMVASIKEFGFRIPVVAKSDGSVVDGHLRLKAAVALGMSEVPVALADELTEAQVKAFRLLANRSANWAEWDDELLALELSELGDMGFDIELTGFNEAEIARLTGEGSNDPNAEWEGMPEFSNPNNCHKKVIVSFENEDDFKEFFSIIGQGHTDATRSIWYPEKQRRDLEAVRYADAAE